MSPSISTSSSTLVLLRHGESTWNNEGVFTGWQDPDLSDRGREEARDAGRLLEESAIAPDVVHTSVLVRAIRTADLVLDEMGVHWLPVRRHWRLNERHYGKLEGLDKVETAERFGPDQVFEWRRSYHPPPPPLTLDDKRHPSHDRRYADLPPDVLPDSECLADVVARMLPYWYDGIVPDLRAGNVVLVAAHGNSLRALVKHLDGISDEDIPALDIPTGVPLVYELGSDLAPADPLSIEDRYLGDPEAIRAATEAVAHQAG